MSLDSRGQLSYAQTMAAAFAGLPYGDGYSRDVIAGRNNTAIDLPYGIVLAFDNPKGTGDSTVTLQAYRAPIGPTDVFKGVHQYTAKNAQGPLDSFGVNGVRPGDAIDVQIRGGINVTSDQASGNVDPTSPVFVRVAPGSAGGANAVDQGGVVRADADVVPAWAATHAYTVGQRVGFPGNGGAGQAGNVYEVTIAGTSAGSGGPSGTGSAIVDGTVTWKYVGTGLDNNRESAIEWDRASWDDFFTGVAGGQVAKIRINVP